MKSLYAPGALEEYLIHNRKSPPSKFVSPKELEVHHDIISAGGYRGPTNWYRSLLRGLGIEEETKDAVDPKLDVPVLFIAESAGPATLPGTSESIKQFAANFKSAQVSSQGHWVQLEARDEVNSILEKRFAEVDGLSTSKL